MDNVLSVAFWHRDKDIFVFNMSLSHVILNQNTDILRVQKGYGQERSMGMERIKRLRKRFRQFVGGASQAPSSSSVTAMGRRAGNAVISWIRTVDIFSRLFIMFIFATLLPMILTQTWSYQKSSRVIQEKVFVSVNEVMNQLSSSVDRIIEKARNDSIEISYMSQIQDVLIDYDKYNSRMLNSAKVDIGKVMSSKYVFDNIASSITLYTLDHQSVNVYGEVIYNARLEGEFLESLLKECYENDGKCVFKAVNGEDSRYRGRANKWGGEIVIGKVVKQKETGEVIGYMVMQINESNFSDIYKTLNQEIGAEIFIMDSEGIIISTAGDYAVVGETYSYPEVLEIAERAGRKKSEAVVIHGQKMVPLSRKMEENDWRVFFLIPQEYLRADRKSVLSSSLAGALISLLLGIGFTFLFSYSILVPMNEAIRGIGEFEKGNLDIVLEETGNDEITRLVGQFNKMAREINGLMERIRGDEKEKRKLEIQALQAQINPHFLSNTLNTVSYIAKMKREETIEVLINATIGLLCDSMKNDDSMHTVEDEIRLIRNYITIQDYRLLGKFTVDIQIEEGIRSCMIPRFILQPVVENSIIHGIEPANRRGVISIKGSRRENHIFFTITDNGIGIESDRIEKVISEPSNQEKARFSGIGIGNVDRRIRLMMGEEYGLIMKSEKNIFTTTEIRLPVLRKEGIANV